MRVIAFSPLRPAAASGRRQAAAVRPSSSAVFSSLAWNRIEPERWWQHQQCIGPRSLLQWSLLALVWRCSRLLFVYSRTRGGGGLLVDTTAVDPETFDSSSPTGRERAPPTFNVGQAFLHWEEHGARTSNEPQRCGLGGGYGGPVRGGVSRR